MGLLQSKPEVWTSQNQQSPLPSLPLFARRYSVIIYFGGAEVQSGRATFDDMLKSFLAILLAAIGIAQAQVGFDLLINISCLLCSFSLFMS